MRYRGFGCWTRYPASGLLTLLVLMIWVPAGARAAGQWDSLLAPESACPGQTDPSLSSAARAQVMVCMHNWARAQEGIPPLIISRPLRVSAVKKARDMIRCQQFSHTACGRDPFYWFKRVGFERGSFGAGENLAIGPQSVWTVRETMSHWLNSDGHRSILLIPSFTEVGIGVVTGTFQGRAGTAAWVVHFGCHHALHAAASAAGDSIYQQLVDATGSNYGAELGATAVQLAGSGL